MRPHGLYVVLIKWLPGQERPHFHPNDRFIMALKGPWRMGTGIRNDAAGMSRWRPARS